MAIIKKTSEIFSKQRIGNKFAEGHKAWNKGIKLPILYLVIDEYITIKNALAEEKLDKELKNIYNTRDSSEVYGGVSSVNFKLEPDRLYGIITTTENIKRIKG